MTYKNNFFDISCFQNMNCIIRYTCILLSIEISNMYGYFIIIVILIFIGFILSNKLDFSAITHDLITSYALTHYLINTILE